jgi:integrase
MHISEFWGLTLSDLDMENRIIRIDHQLQRTSAMEYVIESTQTNAGTRKIPMTEEVYRCFQAILEDREPLKFEKMIDGYSGFLYLDDRGMPLVAMHWEHRFNHMVHRYNDIFREQMPNITPHVCRHTYCSLQAKAGMYPKTLQYLMGHSDISVTMNTYTHLGLEDAVEEMSRMQDVENARKEQEKLNGKTDEVKISKNQFRAG